MYKRVLVLFFGICFLFTACSGDNTQMSREAWLNKDNEEIIFGMTYPVAVTEATTGFLDGVNMAVDEINKKGLLGKKIRILKKDDQGAVTTGSEVAQSFVDDPKISAVIGHWNSRVSNAVADIYNRNGMVMITPASTSPMLTQKGYEYVFRKINDDIDYGSTMARYAARTGLDKVVVYYADDDYGRGLANAFEDAAYENGVQVVDRTTSLSDRNIQSFMDKWNAFDYNAIFVADVMPAALDVIKAIRSAGIQIPIMGATGIDRSSFIKTMGSYAEGITMPTVFNPDTQSTEVQKFVGDYQKKYGQMPDSWAAQGYETVAILCRAVEKAGSAMPEEIAKALYGIKDFEGVSGKLACSPKGEIVGGDIYVKAVKNGKYVYLGKY